MNHTGDQAMSCCSMDIDSTDAHDEASTALTLRQKVRPYHRLIATVIAVIGLGALFATTGSPFWHGFMQYAMGFYFLIFGINQTISLKMSAKMFQGYDPLAKKLPIYGYILPLLQIGIGISYLLWLNAYVINSISIVMLAINTVGVVLVLRRNQTVRCGCLGKSIEVSVGKITLLENVVMISMSLAMILLLATGVHTQKGHAFTQEANPQQGSHSQEH